MKGPEDLVEGIRALIASDWAAKAAEVNATVTDGAELATAWGAMAFDDNALSEAFESPALGLIVDDGDVDITGMGGGSYVGLNAFSLELVVVVRSDITALTGHGLVKTPADAMRLRLYRYLHALVEMVAESGQGSSIGGYYINGPGQYSFRSVQVTQGQGQGMYSIGSITLPFGNSES